MATAKPVVVLFDVDETLVHTGGSGARSWKVAFDKLYGVPADIGAHTSAGETDPEVARETFRAVLEREPNDDELNRIYAMEGAARTKLIPANLNRFFLFGTYGSDSPDRAELTGIGIEKAGRLHAQLKPDQVFVVGDTPRDIEAAQKAGAVSVGVATGHYSVSDLTDAGADHVLQSLAEPFPGL
jgi:phosphoglycolate phosphatase